MIDNLIVPVLNRYDLLNRMLLSIDYPIRNLLIVDNGGAYEDLFGRPELESVESVWILTMPANLGVAGSWNLGIKSFPHAKVWTFASNDIIYRAGALKTLSTASWSSLTLSQGFPHWHTFAVGEAVVDAVGLFDERFAPAYFEDNDYLRRVQTAGKPVTKLPIDVAHDNSSTLNSNPKFQAKNQETFKRNLMLHKQKSAAQEMGWSWTLRDTRAGDWLR